VKVRVIYAEEEAAGADGEPVAWFLMTNRPADSFEAAYETVCWYTQRRKIERFHCVLKSGCTAKKLREMAIDKTAVLVLMYSVIAAAIMNLTCIAQLKPGLPCKVYFEEEEWQLLYRTADKTKKVPVKPYTTGEAVIYLGRLGGPKQASSGGPPGVKTIWAGPITLNTFLAYRLLIAYGWRNFAGQV
jgi:hypothetical protein